MIRDLDIASKLVLGTVQFGLNYGISNSVGKTEEQEVINILDSALNQGINMIDTATAYGNSEAVIGKFCQNRFHVVTKFPSSVNSIEKLNESIQQSLRNINAKSLYGVLAHDAISLINHPELWNGLTALREKGVIRKIGYSLYTPEQQVKLLELNMIPDLVQLPFNFFDQRFKNIIKKLKSLDTEIHIRSIFLQGLFFTNPVTLSDFFDPIKTHLTKIQTLFSDKADLAGWLMDFGLQQEGVDKIVFGVNNLSQLDSNIAAVSRTQTRFIENNCSIPERILMPNLWPKN